MSAKVSRRPCLTTQALAKQEDWFKAPDWKDANAYPQPGSVSLDRWAFEFLCRNEDFQTDFIECFSEVRSEAALDQLSEKWGIAGWFWSPEFKADSVCYFKFSYAESARKGGSGDGTVEISFDLTKPIPPQLDAAKRSLESKRNHQIEQGAIDLPDEFRVRLNNLPVYLRVLDALMDNKKINDIVDVLCVGADNSFPNRAQDKKVRAWIKEAKAIRDGKYRQLVFAKRRPKRKK